MRINHNIMAINTHRSYSVNNQNVSKSSEKLSSGYRINRAGDDAAGLAISEKMRAQIRGLNMASKNSQDAISLVQTTEGALQEVHNILQRMRELAVQAASDTNDTKVDRKALDLEIQQLKEEITAISEVTTFNGIGVLKPVSGLVNNYKIQSGPNAADVLNMNINGLSLSNIGSPIMQTQPTPPATPPIAPPELDYTVISGADSTTPPPSTTGGAQFDGSENAADYLTMLEYLKANNLGASIDYQGSIATDLDSMITALAAAASEGKTLSDAGFATNDLLDMDSLGEAAINGMHAKYVSDANNFAKEVVQFAIQTNNVINYYKPDEPGAPGTPIDIIDTTFTLATDATTATNLLDNISDPTTGMLTLAKQFLSWLSAGQISGTAGSDSTTPSAIDISSVSVATRVGASYAITKVNDAVNSLSLQRAQLGAYQNRLEHKIANLDTSAENLQAAESRIRDIDMAKEMTEFTKNNILAQAATAMLAQANSAPQGVLQLLK